MVGFDSAEHVWHSLRCMTLIKSYLFAGSQYSILEVIIGAVGRAHKSSQSIVRASADAQLKFSFLVSPMNGEKAGRFLPKSVTIAVSGVSHT